MGEREVLVVDSDERSLALAARAFKQAGWNVSAATQMHEALAMLGRRPPNLVISEVDLRDNSGLELCELIKKDVFACRIPFYFLTRHASEGMRDIALQAGAARAAWP